MADISKRKKQMISILLNQRDFISTKEISMTLGVSRRTILREVDDVESWFNDRKVTLERITGKGMKLSLSDERREALKDLIDHEKTKEIFTPFERQKKLLVELLNASEPKKIFYFSNLLKVSEATISYDLDKIEIWLKAWQLNLIRKPGYGIIVEGMESNFRKAIIQVFNEYFDRGELLTLIQDEYIDREKLFKKTSIKKTLLDVVGYTMIESIEEAIQNSGVLEMYPLADSAYAALNIHLSLALKRLLKGESIHYDAQKLEEIMETKEFEYASRIVEEVSRHFNIKIPDEEIGYVTLHIKGSRLKLSETNNIQVKDYEVIYLIEKLIHNIENITGYMLVGDKQLLVGLVNHFGPALSRMRQGMKIHNPLITEMKTRYSEYFQQVKQACVVIEEHLRLTLPDDEIGYLTMHIAAAIETIKKAAESPWKVAVVCSTGIGSSRLLEARIKKVYKNMMVVGVYSTRHLKEKIGTVDLIISTVGIKDMDTPHVVVSPLLIDEDMKKIENILNTIVPLRDKTEGKKSDFLEVLNDLPSLVTAARHLLEGFFIHSVGSDDIQLLTSEASQRISLDFDHRLLQKDLLEREEKGSTWFVENGRLLHCRSKYVETVHFGFLLGDKTFVAVMVGPVDLSAPLRKLLGQISLNLMENAGWLQAVESNNLRKAYFYFEEIIKTHLRSVIA